MKITLTSGVVYTPTTLGKLDLDELKDIAKAEGLVFDADIKKTPLLKLMISELGKVTEMKKQDADKGKSATEEELKERLAQIVAKANEIDAHLETLETEEEKDTFVKASLESIGVDEVTFRNMMQSDAGVALSTIATDTPVSKILANLPVRVVEQQASSKLVSYPLMRLVSPQMVQNGLKQIIYKDFRDADNASGFSDIVIGDFNMGIEPRFTETFQVDTEIHKGYDVLSSMLNDVTIKPSLFISIVNDYALAISHPIAKAMYKRFVTFLSVSTNFDESVAFTSADTKDKAKQLYEFLTSKGTPSRNNLIVKPNGSTSALEYAMETKNMVIIMNASYATNYKYDLSANTFQLGEIKIPVSEIIVQDFAKLDEYLETGATGKVSANELIIFEKGVYEEIIHYTGTKTIDTMKLKSVVHTYTRVKNFRRKDKYLGAFTPNV